MEIYLLGTRMFMIMKSTRSFPSRKSQDDLKNRRCASGRILWENSEPAPRCQPSGTMAADGKSIRVGEVVAAAELCGRSSTQLPHDYRCAARQRRRNIDESKNEKLILMFLITLLGSSAASLRATSHRNPISKCAMVSGRQVRHVHSLGRL